MEARAEYNHNPRCCFLELPLEIRNEIYAYLLAGIDICYFRDEYPPLWTNSPASPVYSPTSPVYSPQSPAFLTSTTPMHSPLAPNFSTEPAVLQEFEQPYEISEGTLLSLPSPMPSNYDEPPSPHQTPPNPRRIRNRLNDDLKIITSADGPQASTPRKDNSRLAILCVNSQIHDEAAHVLYGWNTFSVTISISGYTYSNRTLGEMDIDYETAWEDLNYRIDIDLQNNKRQNVYRMTDTCDPELGDEALSSEESQHITNQGMVLYPSARYRRLIRRLELKINDKRLAPDRIWSVKNNPNPACFDTDMRLLLLPFLWRMRQVFTERTAIAITIERVEHHIWNEREWAGIPSEPDGRAHHNQWALETAYLLTLGPWTHTLKVPEHLEVVQQEVFAKCQRYPEFQEETLQEMMQDLKIDLAGPSMYWGRRQGALFLFKKPWLHASDSPSLDIETKNL